jgi:hypothetical protein
MSFLRHLNNTSQKGSSKVIGVGWSRSSESVIATGFLGYSDNGLGATLWPVVTLHGGICTV